MSDARAFFFTQSKNRRSTRKRLDIIQESGDTVGKVVGEEFEDTASKFIGEESITTVGDFEVSSTGVRKIIGKPETSSASRKVHLRVGNRREADNTASWKSYHRRDLPLTSIGCWREGAASFNKIFRCVLSET